VLTQLILSSYSYPVPHTLRGICCYTSCYNIVYLTGVVLINKPLTLTIIYTHLLICLDLGVSSLISDSSVGHHLFADDTQFSKYLIGSATVAN